MEKIKSPKTGYMVTIGGKTYNQLIKDGYLHGKVKSPKSNRLIGVKGKTYKKLYQEGYFVKITANAGINTGLQELDQEILLNLSLDNLTNMNINAYMKNLMNEPFWCQWLNKHYNIISNVNCKSMAKTLNIKDVSKIYHTALMKGYTPLVKYLLENKLVDPLEYSIEHYSHLEPIETATRYGHLDVVELLLSYQADPITSLYEAVHNHIDIVQYLLQHYTYEQDYLDECLQSATRNKQLDIMKLLIEYGANPETAIISAIHSDDINILKYILSFNAVIPNDAIAIALGLRKYDMLRLLISKTDLVDINVTNDQLEKVLLPYIHNQSLYYEVKYKW